MEVYYSESALVDLDEIERRLAAYSVDAAVRFFTELDDSFKLLAELPLLGKARDELQPGIRSFIYRGNYTILYSRLDEGVLIERVVAPRRDIGGMFR